ncbi:PrpR N-terminal domain-containing protein [Virgibacillus halophilus]|uniref:PrpR N-terminal domain-containing protein n=1 Tax=Tigheibacillus halophilus TaxID=361280 RepID=A0ABU5C2T1_9BACI|nr:PrpR N-terminal domain-containing protein [Virgibacillus halophilus]
MVKALLIAPYSGLAKTAEKLDVPEDVKLDIEIANLQKGVEIAQLAESKGYDIIISRGGTASLIQENVSIPVVHIDINGYDMLRVFTLIREIKSGVALVGFENITRGAATLCNILDYDVNVVTIKSGGEVSGQLTQLKSQGYDVVIGDTITVQVAERLGLRGVLITSGKEALMDAVEEGKRICKVFHHVKNQFQTLQEIYRSIPFPVVLLNHRNEIIDKNPTFLEEIPDEGLLKEETCIEAIQQVRDHGKVQWLEYCYRKKRYIMQMFLANDAAKTVGLIIHPLALKKKEGAIHIENEWSRVPIVGESNYAMRLRDSLPTFAQGNRPICIIGEKGTGKQTIAREVHVEKYNATAPLITIECSAVTSAEIKDWESQLLRIKEGEYHLKRCGRIAACCTRDAGGNAKSDKIANFFIDVYPIGCFLKTAANQRAALSENYILHYPHAASAPEERGHTRICQLFSYGVSY